MPELSPAALDGAGEPRQPGDPSTQLRQPGLSPLAARLLAWYARNARRLPWRERRDPYAIWVAEVMLQQTRVETVIPYFERWLQRFPDLKSLAAASQGEVLSAWEGLGYYSRARNLHRAARTVLSEYGGELPQEAAALRRLPGVGRYTAAAIASIAFGHDEPALDGNIRRALARLFDVRLPARSPEGERRLWELAAAHLPAGQAGAYNQALMDLGATLCTPRRPQCARCPLADLCAAFALGLQEQRPVAAPRAPAPRRRAAAAIIRRNGRVLIARRPQQGLLGGLWEFPGGILQPGEDLPACLQRQLREMLGVEVAVNAPLGVFRHAYSHFRLTLHAFRCTLAQGEPQPRQHEALRWCSLSELTAFPMGKIDRRIAARLLAVDDPPPSAGERP